MIKCILENGRETSFRHVTVGSIVINEKQEVLLVKRAPNLLREVAILFPEVFWIETKMLGKAH